MSSKPAKITLAYRRDGEKSTGRITVLSYSSKGGIEQHDIPEFAGMQFDEMLYQLAKAIAEAGPCDVFLERTDRPGIKLYKLDPVSVDLFRQDPVAAVQAFNYPGGPLSIVKRTMIERVPVLPTLRIGYDVLADSFGERVYTRLVADEIECPGCGYWSPLEGSLFQCKKRCLIRLNVEPAVRWVGVFVQDLLATSLERFYLPRQWNPRPFITRQDLETLYIDFIAEREGAACSTRMQQA